MPELATLLARNVLRRNLRVKKGESVIFESWDHTLPYMGAFVDEARRLGAQPTVLYEDERAWWRAVTEGRSGPFRHLSSAEKAAVEGADVYLYFWGPAEMGKALDLGDAVNSRFTAFNQEWYAAARRGGLRGCRMSLGFASDPAAARFGLSGPAWRAGLMRAGSVDARKMLARGRAVAAKIARGSELRLRHRNGTDLRVSLRGARTRILSELPERASKAKPMAMLGNSPSGQVMVALDRNDASGTLVSNRTVYDFFRFEKFAGSRWTFDGGRLRDGSVTVGRKAFERSFAAAPPDRDRLSYLSIGLNPMTRNLPPCEDTEEGAVLVGIGGNGVAGGRIRIPFTGFAMIGDATLTIDDVAIARAGRIL